jgi:hypothetical protein
MKRSRPQSRSDAGLEAGVDWPVDMGRVLEAVEKSAKTGMSVKLNSIE